MSCPFGFGQPLDSTCEDFQQFEEKGEEDGKEANVDEKEPKKTKSKKNKGKNSMPKDKDPDGKERFDFEKDPISWFYQNQIKSEEEFQAKKAQLREMARKRLDDIMAKKGKGLLWDDDSDLDDLSISSAELSDLDSDVDSLASLMSCANSWIEEAMYTPKGEALLKYSAGAAVAVAAHCIWVSFQAMNVSRKVAGVILHTWWPTLSLGLSCFIAAFAVLALLSTHYRSKRLLLGGQIGLLLGYSAAAVLAVLVFVQPTIVDAKLKQTACVRYGANDQGSRLCSMLPGIEKQMFELNQTMLWSVGLMAATCMLLVILGVWYLFELAYIEKKAIKHKRRHKRRKHTIPWHKIKITGPVMTCGGGPAAPGGKAGSSCPLGFQAHDKNL